MADGSAPGGGGDDGERWPIVWFAICQGYPGFVSVVVWRYVQPAPFAELVRDSMPCAFAPTIETARIGARMHGAQANVAEVFGYRGDDYRQFGAPELAAEWVAEVWV